MPDSSGTETLSAITDTLNSGQAEDIDDLELNYIISVAEGYNYDSLRAIALQTAQKLSFKFDTLGRYYNPQKGIVLSENDEDEMWAGQYYFRRIGDNLVSVEMSYAYTDTAMSVNEQELEKHRQDTTRMFVFAMMYPDKKSADSLANIIKADYSSVKVFPAQIYMGCMH